MQKEHIIEIIFLSILYKDNYLISMVKNLIY